MENKRIFLASPHMGGNEIKYIEDAFKKNYIAPLGEYVDRLEDDIKKYTSVKGAVALSSGTAALHLALKVLDVKEGDIVFCSDLTFSASANPIMYEKAIPVFIDSDEDTFNMSPLALKKAFEKYKNPKAVIVANLYGQSADMDEILKICNSYNTPVIEDAAESLGATYKGKSSGTFGKIGCYSFNGNKIITTSGGGMLISDDETLVEKARFLSTQAREKQRHYEHKEVGYNYRMSNISAAIGVGQIEVLNDRINKKRYIYSKYKEELEKIEYIHMMPMAEYGKSNCWLSVITIDKTSTVKPLDIILALEEQNIESRPIWKPMHMQPVFKNFDFISKFDDNNSVSENIFNSGVCLPSDTKMTDEEISKIISIIKKCFN